MNKTLTRTKLLDCLQDPTSKKSISYVNRIIKLCRSNNEFATMNHPEGETITDAMAYFNQCWGWEYKVTKFVNKKDITDLVNYISNYWVDDTITVKSVSLSW